MTETQKLDQNRNPKTYLQLKFYINSTHYIIWLQNDLSECEK